jgi:hypothetical protein
MPINILKKAAFSLQLKVSFFRFAILTSSLSLLIAATPFPGKPDYYSFKKNQVMKKIKLIAQNENAQAFLVIAGFLVIFSLLAIFFMNK